MEEGDEDDLDLRIKWKTHVVDLYDIPKNVSNNDLFLMIFSEMFRPEIKLVGNKSISLTQPRFTIHRWMKKMKFGENTVRGVLELNNCEIEGESISKKKIERDLELQSKRTEETKKLTKRLQEVEEELKNEKGKYVQFSRMYSRLRSNKAEEKNLVAPSFEKSLESRLRDAEERNVKLMGDREKYRVALRSQKTKLDELRTNIEELKTMYEVKVSTLQSEVEKYKKKWEDSKKNELISKEEIRSINSVSQLRSEKKRLKRVNEEFDSQLVKIFQMKEKCRRCNEKCNEFILSCGHKWCSTCAFQMSTCFTCNERIFVRIKMYE